MTSDVYTELLAFLNRLDESKIAYTLHHNRPESVLIYIDVPGERWEVEFMIDGSVEVERFVTTASIDGREALADLFKRFTD